MVFNSLSFLLFSLLFFPAYFALRGRQRMFLLLAASYVFYAWWDWRFCGLIAFSTAVDFAIGQRIPKASSRAIAKQLLMVSLVANLGLLAIFKYFDFFTISLQQALGLLGLDVSLPLLNAVLPVGISFYTFQTLSYTIDVWRGRVEPEPSLLHFATYVAMFPQLVAGPIVRASDLLPQLNAPKPLTFERALSALEAIAWGLFLKLCVADNLAVLADATFGVSATTGRWTMLVGLLCFTFQIYGDFAGYSLVAIGLGRALGFDFPRNFERPYFAVDFSDFWQRWHISLSQWLRDYLYIPLGGNRGGYFNTQRNLMITMLLGGLWHGASWNFLIWGGLHGLYLVLQRVLEEPLGRAAEALRLPSWLRRMMGMALVFSLTTFAWIFFRSATLQQAWEVIDAIVSRGDLRFSMGQNSTLVRSCLMLGMLLVVDALSEIEAVRRWYGGSDWARVLGFVAVVLLIVLFGQFSGASFLYFQF